MKTTYIIGAGFSRYANLPLMNDFYFHSKDIYSKLSLESDKKSFQKVFKYFDEFSKVKHIMNADFYNIEELLSIIEMDSYINGNRSIYKDYLIYLKRVIELSSPSIETKEGDYEIEKNINTEIFTTFIKLVYGIKLIEARSGDSHYNRDPQNDNGIISLNYDTILEMCLKSINKHNSYHLGVDYKSYDYEYGIKDELVQFTYSNKPRERRLKLSKIHGSINFLKDDLPIIVPPTWNKTSNKHMQSVWSLAHSILSDSEKIVFIGYSLPETDLYVKYLLISGIKLCYNLKEIIVVCPDEKGVIQERYEKFFDINYRNKAFTFIPKTFEEWLGKPKKKIKSIEFF
jgi:hypothetical protein